MLLGKSETIMTKTKRILVSIPHRMWGIIEKNYKGKLGNNDSEVIRNILMLFLEEKGLLTKGEE